MLRSYGRICESDGFGFVLIWGKDAALSMLVARGFVFGEEGKEGGRGTEMWSKTYKAFLDHGILDPCWQDGRKCVGRGDLRPRTKENLGRDFCQ